MATLTCAQSLCSTAALLLRKQKFGAKWLRLQPQTECWSPVVVYPALAGFCTSLQRQLASRLRKFHRLWASTTSMREVGGNEQVLRCRKAGMISTIGGGCYAGNESAASRPKMQLTSAQPVGTEYGAIAFDESPLLMEASSHGLSSSWRRSFTCLIYASLDDS